MTIDIHLINSVFLKEENATYNTQVYERYSLKSLRDVDIL